MNFRHPLSLLLLLLGIQIAPAEAATCQTAPVKEIPLALTNLDFKPGSAHPVGARLGAKWSNHQYVNYAMCDAEATLRLVVSSTSGLVPASGPGRYQTGIPGTELEIGFGYNADEYAEMFADAGWELSVPASKLTNQWVRIPRKIVARLIRTGSYVPRTGEMGPVSFEARLMNGTQTLQVFAINNVTLTLTNNVILMSCVADRREIQVPMGPVAASVVRAGTAPERRYSMDVKCAGGPENAPAPVKVYFVGDTTPDGILRLSPQPGTAAGVGIALSAADGTKLPFSDRANALDMAWIEKLNGMDRYRFEGSAKYVAIPDEAGPRPGRADAVMTYVLDYN